MINYKDIEEDNGYEHDNNRLASGTEIANFVRHANTQVSDIQRMCSHTYSGNRRVVPLVSVYSKLHNAPNVNIPDPYSFKHPKYVSICLNCFKVFNGRLYSQEEVDDALFTISSIFDQIKSLADLNDDEEQTIEKYQTALDKDILMNVDRFYAGLREDLIAIKEGKKKGNKRKNKSERGFLSSELVLGKLNF